jgi:outer membrane protein assembly factor BamB
VKSASRLVLRPATPLAFLGVPGLSSLGDGHTRVLGDEVTVICKGEQVCIDLRDRAEAWRKPAPTDGSAPAKEPSREWSLGDGLVAVKLSEQRLALDGPAAERRWTATFRPYVYDVTRMHSGAVLVATAGQGGYVYVVNADTGEIATRTKVPGGASDFVHSRSAGGTSDGHVLASGWGAFARIEPAGGVTLWKARDAFRVIWARGDEVALLTNPPRPGVAFVACR